MTEQRDDTLAFMVQDEWGDGEGVIVFHTSNAAARRIGCEQLDVPWEHATCRRTPQFDQYAPGPIPARAWMEQDGWWMNCAGPGCGGRVDAEDTPVFSETLEYDVFCCAACRDKRERQMTSQPQPHESPQRPNA